MFCKWCGKKIANIGSPCPWCGKDQPLLESGNGFWDLCTTPPVKQSVSGDSTIDQKGNNRRENGSTASNSRKVKPSIQFWIGAWVATCTLLVIALVLIGIVIGMLGHCLSEIDCLHSDIKQLTAHTASTPTQAENDPQGESEDPVATEPQDSTEAAVQTDADSPLEESTSIAQSDAASG